MGIYQAAFDPAIHTLCMMERELRRAQKDWSAAKKETEDARESGASDKLIIAYMKAADSYYSTIMSLRRDILSHRDALGLTPKGLQRLRSKDTPVGDEGRSGAAGATSVLQAIFDKVTAYE